MYYKMWGNKKHRRLYLQLLEVFIIRELKSRYRSSILGPLWIIIDPLLFASSLSIIFGYFMKVNTGDVPYFIFFYCGLLFWNFFQQGINLAKNSLVWNRELIVKSAFPKDILPLSYVLSKIPDFFISFFVLIFLYLLSGHTFQYRFFLIILTIPVLIFITSAFSLLSSLSNAVFRDFGRIFDFFLMIAFYATPIVYSESLIPTHFKFLIYTNPIAQVIVFARKLIFNNSFDGISLIFSFIISVVVFLFAYFLFKKYEPLIVDLI